MKTSQKKNSRNAESRRNMSQKVFTTFTKRDLVRRGDGGGKRLRATVQSELLVNLSFYAEQEHYAYSIYAHSYHIRCYERFIRETK